MKVISLAGITCDRNVETDNVFENVKYKYFSFLNVKYFLKSI